MCWSFFRLDHEKKIALGYMYSAKSNFFQILWKIRCNILVSFPFIWKNYVLYWDFDLKSWIVDFFTRFTQEKTPQNNFSSQNFSVENNYFLFYPPMMPFCVLIKTNLINFCSNSGYSTSNFRHSHDGATGVCKNR